MEEKPTKENETAPPRTPPAPDPQPPAPAITPKPDHDSDDDQPPGVLPARDLRKNLGCG